MAKINLFFLPHLRFLLLRREKGHKSYLQADPISSHPALYPSFNHPILSAPAGALFSVQPKIPQKKKQRKRKGKERKGKENRPSQIMIEIECFSHLPARGEPATLHEVVHSSVQDRNQFLRLV